uniref:Uncharacterized protein n=1 Tax=Daucus carota subsp. sativus TaxID=79200 RepID=A0A165YE81_DAUCS
MGVSLEDSFRSDDINAPYLGTELPSLPSEGAEVDVDADANREDDLADPLLADGEEKQEEKPAERPRKTLKNMTSMNAPVIVELEGETDPIEALSPKIHILDVHV